jgi:hypothetical protein
MKAEATRASASCSERSNMTMYTAFIVGGSKRIEDIELDNVFRKLERERIEIHRAGRLQVKNRLEHTREVFIHGTRMLSNREMFNRHFRKPFKPLQRTEDVQIRIIRDNR